MGQCQHAKNGRVGLVDPVLGPAWRLGNPHFSSVGHDFGNPVAEADLLFQRRPSGGTSIDEEGLVQLHDLLDPRDFGQIRSEHDVGRVQSCFDAGQVVQGRVADDVAVGAQNDTGRVFAPNGRFHSGGRLRHHPPHEGQAPFVLHVCGVTWQINPKALELFQHHVNFRPLEKAVEQGLIHSPKESRPSVMGLLCPA